MTNIVKALIETNNKGALDSEMQDVYNELKSRQIDVDLFSRKTLQRRQLHIEPQILVVGYVDSMLSVFRQLNIPIPSTNDYPKSLNYLLYRKIWESNLKTLRQEIYAGRVPIFAKPKDRKKRFTGRVFNTIDDFMWSLSGVSIQTPIYCSEVVSWVTEYRIYVTNGQIVGNLHYSGNSNIRLDNNILKSAVATFSESVEASAGYAIDMGLLSSGETALIEWNDGFSLGSYGLNPSLYTDLLIARWCELMKLIT